MNLSTCLTEEPGLWSMSKDNEEPASSQKIRLRYERARSICKQSGLTIDDIRGLTPRFWEFHFDLISTRDMSAFIIAVIHLNLCIGTLSEYAKIRPHPELLNLLTYLINFDVCGEFMLTEIGHGLDARHLETTATLLPEGGFDLHTPNEAAAKAMPPSTPIAGIPRVAVVFARLMVGDDDYGIKTFVVWLNDSAGMKKGITSRALPTRPGTKPLDHSITSFEHVRLAPEALLGPLKKPEDERTEFFSQIGRVTIGTLSLSIMGVSALKIATKIAATYSQRRTVTAVGSTKLPILSFSTQQRPMLDGLVNSIVLESFARWAIGQFMEPSATPNVRHAIATIFKATVTRTTYLVHELSERCGWQGLFMYNQLSGLALTFQGNSIAEGDTLIRLASELLGDKYRLPPPRDPAIYLALHEAGLFLEAREKITSLGGYGKHRSQGFNNHILPRCRPLIEAIGHRMAYEAAKESKVCSEILDLFESLHISEDLSWYIENGLITRVEFSDCVTKAYNQALPILLDSLKQTPDDDYITAPIMTEASWNKFFHGFLVSKEEMSLDV